MPRGGLGVGSRPTEQLSPREQQLTFDEGTPVGEQDGGLERVGEPEELARPILRSDRFAEESVDQAEPPDVADRREELPRLPEPALGGLCPAHGDLDGGDPQTMGRCEPGEPVAIENVPPSFLVLAEPGIVTGGERGRRPAGRDRRCRRSVRRATSSSSASAANRSNGSGPSIANPNRSPAAWVASRGRPAASAWRRPSEPTAAPRRCVHASTRGTDGERGLGQADRRRPTLRTRRPPSAPRWRRTRSRPRSGER